MSALKNRVADGRPMLEAAQTNACEQSHTLRTTLIDSDAPARTSGGGNDANPNTTPHSHGHILVIEDEPLIAMELEFIIQTTPYALIGIASTKREAVEMARQQPPRLILSDISLLDGSSGVDAVREIRQLCAAPVIFLSARTDLAEQAEAWPNVQTVTKPFDSETIRGRIMRALRSAMDGAANAGSARAQAWDGAGQSANA